MHTILVLELTLTNVFCLCHYFVVGLIERLSSPLVDTITSIILVIDKISSSPGRHIPLMELDRLRLLSVGLSVTSTYN